MVAGLVKKRTDTPVSALGEDTELDKDAFREIIGKIDQGLRALPATAQVSPCHPILVLLNCRCRFRIWGFFRVRGFSKLCDLLMLTFTWREGLLVFDHCQAVHVHDHQCPGTIVGSNES